MDLILDLQDKMKKLDTANKHYANAVEILPHAEHDYRTALAKAVVVERANGTPVSIIADICKGKDDVAELKLQRDIAEGQVEAAKEHINSLKLQIRVIEEAIEREWHSQ